MIAELSHLALCAALLLASFSCVYCDKTSDNFLFLKKNTGIVFALISLAIAGLSYSYLTSDFSLLNVYENSHTAKPLFYKFSGMWGNHEGSLLLWLWFLSIFAYAGSRNAASTVEMRVYLFLLCGFLAFLLFTSNPFARLFPPAMEGKDLNPLLQDVGLAIHPPLLYLGYVGFSVVFARTIAALWHGRIQKLWAKDILPWAMLAWGFLTFGIALGSWWAYRELGWGGYWFWDPVENISLLPWLFATALIHGLFLARKTGAFPYWTALLAITTFLFSLIGTFLVRSGLITSVHAFATDPTRGIYLLLYIFVVSICAYTLFAKKMHGSKPASFTLFSKETGITLHHVLVLTACFTVFLGILYPIILQSFGLTSVSVGAPFYHTVMPPLAIVIVLLAGVAPLLSFRATPRPLLWRYLKQSLMLAGILLVLVLSVFYEQSRPLLALPFMACLALAGIGLMAASLVLLQKQSWQKDNIANMGHVGMVVCHFFLGIMAIAIAITFAGSEELERTISPESPVVTPAWEITLLHTETFENHNYISQRATLRFYDKAHNRISVFTPEIRFFPTRNMETSETDIHTNLAKDVYTAIATSGNFSKDNKRFILRFHIIPAMIWVWIAAGGIGIGGWMISAACFVQNRQQRKHNATNAI